MYEEIMTNNDNLESYLLTSSLLKNIWFTCWYKVNCVVDCSVAEVELKIMCTGDLPLQVNYAVGRLVAVTVYC